MVDATPPGPGAGRKSTGRCPICRTPADHQFRPFCSRRCSDIDLSRWLNGAYAIAGGDADADEDGDDATAHSLGAKSGEAP